MAAATNNFWQWVAEQFAAGFLAACAALFLSWLVRFLKTPTVDKFGNSDGTFKNLKIVLTGFELLTAAAENKKPTLKATI
jgi:hypothetical protein